MADNQHRDGGGGLPAGQRGLPGGEPSIERPLENVLEEDPLSRRVCLGPDHAGAVPVLCTGKGDRDGPRLSVATETAATRQNHNRKAEYQDFVEIPDLVLSPVIAAMSALWYVNEEVIPQIRGDWTVVSVTTAIAGDDQQGLEDRETRYNQITANVSTSCQ